jgi:23S rRNA pseudouridine1911/1915/1917 synthase
MAEPLVVLYEDAHCLAVVKPAGLLTQSPAVGELTLEALVRAYLSPEAPGSAYVGIVHRLDRPVSGVVLWAKTPKAARSLSRQFERRSVRKHYWAVVERGLPGPDRDREGEEVWEDWLTRPGQGGIVRVVVAGTPGARRAVTRVSQGEARRLPAGCDWLILQPETGRTHQLRAQAAARGRPIVGDSLYGSPRSFPNGIALHARSLTVSHPLLRQPLTLVAPPPPEWPAQRIELATSERTGLQG